MTDLTDLVSLFQDLCEKSRAQHEAFTKIDKLIRRDGFYLYWDDCEERYCICPLPKTLERGKS